MKRRLARRQSLRAVFAIPAVLGIATATGLVLGLVGDGWWDAAAWLLLVLLPLSLVVAWRGRDR